MVYGHGLVTDEAVHLRWCRAARALASHGAGGGADAPLLELGSGWRGDGSVVAELAPARPATGSSASASADIRRHFRGAACEPAPAVPPAEDDRLIAAAATEGEGAPDSEGSAPPAAAKIISPSRVGERCSIVQVHWPPASQPGLAALRMVQRFLDAELGEASCPVRRRGTTGAAAGGVQYFLAVTPGGGLAGAVVVERVGTAFRVRAPGADLAETAFRMRASSFAPADGAAMQGTPGADQTESERPCEGDARPDLPPAAAAGIPFSAPLAISSALAIEDPVAVVLGIAQVWVTPAWRRQGVARSLLDAAAAHAVHGYAVPRGEVAFSQTTAAGGRLAVAYVGRPDFMVYL